MLQNSTLKKLDDSMTMSLRVDDSKLSKKYCKIWKTIISLLGIEFDSEPVYGDIDSYVKTKVKMYDNRVNTNFQGKEVPKKDSSYNCLILCISDILSIFLSFLLKYCFSLFSL